MDKKPKIVSQNVLQTSEFFNPLDRGQVKYEMLRAHLYEGRFITRVCKEFGYSRESFYKALESFHKEGLSGLALKRTGKKKPDKVTPEIIGYVIYQRAKFDLSGAAIARKIVNKFDLKLHKRTIERILGHYGLLEP